MRVYLAGPDVFFPDPHARAALLKSICAEFGLEGVSPLDEPPPDVPAAWAELPEAMRIAWYNEAHILTCDVLVANLTPFRSPSADVGTVYEMGFMRALGNPVYGWSNNARPFAERTRSFTGANGTVDGDGLLIEDFGLADNLMIQSAIQSSGGAFFSEPCARDQYWTGLVAFRACLGAVAGAALPTRRRPRRARKS